MLMWIVTHSSSIVWLRILTVVLSLGETMASATPPSKADASPSKAGDGSSQEDASTIHLRRAWRSFASTIVVAARAAGKAKDASTKELDDAVVSVLRGRIMFRRSVTHVEAKLTGQAQEMEALEGCMRSQPSVGRKRKRDTQQPKSAAATMN
jgi:hypothetical protein